MRDKLTGELVQNLTSSTPRFLVQDLPPSNLIAGLNLTVYTATLGGTVNSMEAIGVFTSKVAELQTDSVEEVSTMIINNCGLSDIYVRTVLKVLKRF